MLPQPPPTIWNANTTKKKSDNYTTNQWFNKIDSTSEVHKKKSIEKLSIQHKIIPTTFPALTNFPVIKNENSPIKLPPSTMNHPMIKNDKFMNDFIKRKKNKTEKEAAILIQRVFRKFLSVKRIKGCRVETYTKQKSDSVYYNELTYSSSESSVNKLHNNFSK